MRKTLIMLALSVMVCGLYSGLKGDLEMEKKHVVLLGASVGREWNISSLPERMNNQDYDFEYVGFSGFDKSDALKELISRDEGKPDIVILKECAAYFPGDFDHYKNLMKQWVTLCRKEGIIPVPTTIVPVTRLHAFKKFLIDIAKGRNPLDQGNPLEHKRNHAILSYNDWVKEFAEEQGLVVLDLEAAVHYSESNRFLKENLAKVDGLHVNSMAYKSMDLIVIPTMDRAGEK